MFVLGALKEELRLEKTAEEGIEDKVRISKYKFIFNDDTFETKHFELLFELFLRHNIWSHS